MTDPLVPPEVDLRDFPYMPLHVTQLRRSRAWLIAKSNPELGFYMLNLWGASWHEVPAASLEDDVAVLADAAMCKVGRWPKVRALVLRSWVQCSDGRLYHPVVAKLALEAWGAKCAQRARTAAATAARALRRNGERDVERNGQRDEHRDVNATFTKGREEKGREVKPKSKANSRARETPLPPDFSISDRVAEWAAGKGYDRLPEYLEAFIGKARAKGYTYIDWDDAFMNSIREDWGKVRASKSNSREPTLQEKRAANMDEITGRKRERTIDADAVDRAPVRPALRYIREQDDDDVG